MKSEDLEVWKRAPLLCMVIFLALRKLKDYGFKDRITRSALSMPSSIAEGFERSSKRECLSFLSCPKGSCGELRTQTHIAMEIWLC